MTKEKLLIKIQNNYKNVKFGDFIILLESFGFKHQRTKGSHNIYKHSKGAHIMNVQDSNGSAKPYQIKQFFDLVNAYGLKQED